jgi:hypothetical protein
MQLPFRTPCLVTNMWQYLKSTKNVPWNFTLQHTIYLWLYSPLLNLGRFFSILILYTDDRTSWAGDQPMARPLSTHRTTEIQKKAHRNPCPEWESNPRSQRSCLTPRGHCGRLSSNIHAYNLYKWQNIVKWKHLLGKNEKWIQTKWYKLVYSRIESLDFARMQFFPRAVLSGLTWHTSTWKALSWDTCYLWLEIFVAFLSLSRQMSGSIFLPFNTAQSGCY